MTVEEVAQLVLQALEEHEIAYMVVGSLASNMHGVPRATQDADIVIECNKPSLDSFMDSLQGNFYADKQMALDALKNRSMFNVIHYSSGFKIDLIVRKLRSFDLEEFERRIQMDFRGAARWVASPEDTILAKLEWSQMSESERQLMDAVNIARIQGSALDRNYLQTWANELRVTDLLTKLFYLIDQQ